MFYFSRARSSDALHMHIFRIKTWTAPELLLQDFFFIEIVEYCNIWIGGLLCSTGRHFYSSLSCMHYSNTIYFMPSWSVLTCVLLDLLSCILYCCHFLVFIVCHYELKSSNNFTIASVCHEWLFDIQKVIIDQTSMFFLFNYECNTQMFYLLLKNDYWSTSMYQFWSDYILDLGACLGFTLVRMVDKQLMFIQTKLADRKQD